MWELEWEGYDSPVSSLSGKDFFFRMLLTENGLQSLWERFAVCICSFQVQGFILAVPMYEKVICNFRVKRQSVSFYSTLVNVPERTENANTVNISQALSPVCTFLKMYFSDIKMSTTGLQI